MLHRKFLLTLAAAIAAFCLPCVAFSQTTPNMSIVKPTPGVTLGPTWAQMINDGLDLIDAHDHSSGHGVKIGPSGMNINADLGFNLLYKAKDLKSTQYTSQSSAISGASEAGSIQNVNGNAVWINGSGVAVPITSGGSVVSNVTNAFSTQTPGGYPYSVTGSDAQKTLLVNTSSPRTINLPAATTVVYFMIKDSTGSAATNAISVVPNGTNTIDGVNATKSLASNFGYWVLISDGVSNWSLGTLSNKVNNSDWSGTALAPANGGTSLTATPTNGQLPIGNGSAYTLATLTGTSNQISITNGAGSITLATPQNIHTGASPAFAGLNLSGLTASLPVVTDGSKNLATVTGASFKSTYAIAGSGTNTDITALNGLPSASCSPTVTGAGPNTASGQVTNQCNYSKIGPLTFIEVSVSFTSGGSAGTIWYITTPTPPAADNVNVAWICAAEEGTTNQNCRYRSDGAKFAVFKAGGTTWATSGTITLHLRGWYF